MTVAHSARVYDEIVSFFAGGPNRQEISAFRLSTEARSRLRQLPRKKSAGTLTEDEAEELDECVHLDRLLLLIRSRALEQRTSLGA
ncbi:MAG TPA: hypothetical protein VN837_19560 [Chloroflexota bacterium]|nr:hypothetical protein [Chloroflexota bacterium]